MRKIPFKIPGNCTVHCSMIFTNEIISKEKGFLIPHGIRSLSIYEATDT